MNFLRVTKVANTELKNTTKHNIMTTKFVFTYGHVFLQGMIFSEQADWFHFLLLTFHSSKPVQYSKEVHKSPHIVTMETG